MKLLIPGPVMDEIRSHGEKLYPEEGAGLILGSIEGEHREARRVLPMPNHFNSGERNRRYLLDPQEILQAEELAEQLGLEVIGIFHSHPDHPPAPSQYDLDWAVPWYVYLITRVEQGAASESRAWRMLEDHTRMVEQALEIEDGEG
ncbi:MAG: M67 family metallopeptidase [Chloroflexi bacterium]|nr:M67 family metallopeptidase [Chloroflexota bacterium]